jgi:hypothetical protein
VRKSDRRIQVPRPQRAARHTSDEQIDYFARLRARQLRPLSARASRALDEANRGER